MSRKIKKDDEVIVIAGRDKSKTGKVIRMADKGNRAYVEGVNKVKKHQKPNPQLNQPGGIIEKEASIHISNLAILNSVTGKADRVGFKILEDGAKARFFKSTKELVNPV